MPGRSATQAPLSNDDQYRLRACTGARFYVCSFVCDRHIICAGLSDWRARRTAVTFIDDSACHVNANATCSREFARTAKLAERICSTFAGVMPSASRLRDDGVLAQAEISRCCSLASGSARCCATDYASAQHCFRSRRRAAQKSTTVRVALSCCVTGRLLPRLSHQVRRLYSTDTVSRNLLVSYDRLLGRSRRAPITARTAKFLTLVNSALLPYESSGRRLPMRYCLPDPVCRDRPCAGACANMQGDSSRVSSRGGAKRVCSRLKTQGLPRARWRAP